VRRRDPESGKVEAASRKSCGNAGPVEGVESEDVLPSLPTGPWKARRMRDSSTFPQLRRTRRKCGKPNAGFPHFRRTASSLLLKRRQKPFWPLARPEIGLRPFPLDTTDLLMEGFASPRTKRAPLTEPAALHNRCLRSGEGRSSKLVREPNHSHYPGTDRGGRSLRPSDTHNGRSGRDRSARTHASPGGSDDPGVGCRIVRCMSVFGVGE